ncbi:hypothetical protein [Streptomyces griseocarneus]|uniref:hypothetical protein n=1 Tax=Streptomyces griseocarneus TaxID=51201 RepID=UPI00167CC9D4|nr:hypothetical protein [Streptomyces griseocarneus]MBZ6472531.1 hypothetical protein [Streptomyces griseocarneus]
MVRRTYGEASTSIRKLIQGNVEAYSAYTDVELPRDPSSWTVCFQGPAAGVPLAPAHAAPRLHLTAPGTTCPTRMNTSLHPEPTHEPTREPSPAHESSPGPDPDNGSSGDGSTRDSDSGDGAASSGGGGAGVVRPGSFCAPQGATGVTAKGTSMVCGPGSDGRNRWRAG